MGHNYVLILWNCNKIDFVSFSDDILFLRCTSIHKYLNFLLLTLGKKPYCWLCSLLQVQLLKVELFKLCSCSVYYRTQWYFRFKNLFIEKNNVKKITLLIIDNPYHWPTFSHGSLVTTLLITVVLQLREETIVVSMGKMFWPDVLTSDLSTVWFRLFCHKTFRVVGQQICCWTNSQKILLLFLKYYKVFFLTQVLLPPLVVITNSELFLSQQGGLLSWLLLLLLIFLPCCFAKRLPAKFKTLRVASLFIFQKALLPEDVLTRKGRKEGKGGREDRGKPRVTPVWHCSQCPSVDQVGRPSASWVWRNLQLKDCNSCGGWRRSGQRKNKAYFQSRPLFSLWHPHSCGFLQKSGPNSRSQSRAGQIHKVQ